MRSRAIEYGLEDEILEFPEIVVVEDAEVGVGVEDLEWDFSERPAEGWPMNRDRSATNRAIMTKTHSRIGSPGGGRGDEEK